MLPWMFKRQTTGSVVCVSCGSLVGVNDDKCYTCGRRNPGLWGYAPLLRRLGNDMGFVTLVIYGCSVLYAATLLGTVLLGGSILGDGLFSMLAPNGYVVRAFGASGAIPVFVDDMWWTVLSAGWLHGSALHILFNMMWVRQLGPVDRGHLRRGPHGHHLHRGGGGRVSREQHGGSLPRERAARRSCGVRALTLGASAPIFGLLGALVHYGRRGGSSLIGGQAMQYAVVLFVFGLIMPGGGIDNYAHAGGFVGGYGASLWLDPLRPEKMNHVIGAILCLAFTALSVLASLLIWIPRFFP